MRTLIIAFTALLATKATSNEANQELLDALSTISNVYEMIDQQVNSKVRNGLKDIVYEADNNHLEHEGQYLDFDYSISQGIEELQTDIKNDVNSNVGGFVESVFEEQSIVLEVISDGNENGWSESQLEKLDEQIGSLQAAADAHNSFHQESQTVAGWKPNEWQSFSVRSKADEYISESESFIIEDVVYENYADYVETHLGIEGK